MKPQTKASLMTLLRIAVPSAIVIGLVVLVVQHIVLVLEALTVMGLFALFNPPRRRSSSTVRFFFWF